MGFNYFIGLFIFTQLASFLIVVWIDGITRIFHEMGGDGFIKAVFGRFSK